MVRPDGTGLRQLTNASLRHLDENVSPAWSPDGKRIVFVSNRAVPAQKEKPTSYWRSGKASLEDIYVMNADGTRQRRLTQLPGESIAPDWGARR